MPSNEKQGREARESAGGDDMKSRDVYRFAETAVYIVFTAGWAFAIIAGACR